jgi:palmitoyltransferase ZDHHC2/15/20
MSLGCRCSTLLRFIYFVPVLFIWSIIFWSYYAYNYSLCFISLENPIQKAIYMIFYHFIFAIFMAAYCQTIWTKHPKVPNHFILSESESRELTSLKSRLPEYRYYLEQIVTTRRLPIVTRDGNGCYRVCSICNIIKPDRAHHCSTCKQCILKMDHHCPWVDNCVGFGNYKFFVQFLLYGVVFSVYVWTTAFASFLDAFNARTATFSHHKLHVIMFFFVGVVFSVALLCLGGYHLYLTARNKTTLETFRKPCFTVHTKYGFDVGIKQNYFEVFGPRLIDFLLPISTQLGNGVSFSISKSRVSPAMHDEEAVIGLLEEDHLNHFLGDSTAESHLFPLNSNNVSTIQ